MFVPSLRVWTALAGLCLAGLVLVACASLSEDQCRGGDWQGIGYTDGTKGATPSRLADHQKACAEYGISPNIGAWEAGRQAGLRVYCTPENAYSVGREGNSLSTECTPAELSLMRQPHHVGKQYYELNREKRRLESERSDIESQLSSLRSDDDDYLRRERRRLQRESARLEGRIRQIELDIRRFDSWRA